MKLPDHVDNLRNQISSAFDKQFSRLGIGPAKKHELERIPQDLHTRRQRFEEMFESHLDETGSYESAREKLIDELTFTLFNRIAAVKVMEAANLFPPIITKKAEHGGRSFGHKAWLEIRPDMRSEELEGIRDYILQAFNELGETLPLYSPNYPYGLLPDPISLNEIIDAFNAVEKDSQVGEDIWQSDDVLGWLYESYNNAKKAEFKDSKAKTEYDKVSLQSQVYTPRWVVKFLVDNSLGKLYLEMYPDSKIKDEFKIANAPETREREIKPLDEVKLIDPACGSGNFLLYAFDLFYALYLDQIENYDADYYEDAIPQLIIENNLHGIDLDDRAVQLAQLGLYIKARKRRRNIPSLQFKLVSSDFYLPEYDEVRDIFEEGVNLDRNQKALIADIWGDLQLAYKFGSLIRLDEKIKARMSTLIAKREKVQPKMFSDEDLRVEPEPVQRELFLEGDIEQERRFMTSFFENLITAVTQYALISDNDFLASKTRDAVMFLELLNTEYDVATANPPYTDRGNFGAELKLFIEDNYKRPQKFHTNLYAAFIKRCYELVFKDGKIALIHPDTFMFIKTFEDVRSFILNSTHINVMIHYPQTGGVFGIGVIYPAFYVLEKQTDRKLQNSIFINIENQDGGRKKEESILQNSLDDYISGIKNERNYTVLQSELKIIKSCPIIYWISSEFREKFELDSIENYMTVCKGLTTANNNRFLRYQWEVNPKKISNDYEKDKKKWVRFSKGGNYNKWYGNLWLLVNWENHGYEIKNYFDANGKQRSRPQNEKYYFNKGITGSFSSGAKGITFRKLPENFITEGASGGVFFDKGFEFEDYALSFLNSKLSAYISNCLNPTVTTEVGDIKRIPFLYPNDEVLSIVSSLANQCAKIKMHLCSYSIIVGNFKTPPFQNNLLRTLKERAKDFLNYEIRLLTLIQLNENIINEKIFELYDLSRKDKDLVMAKTGESVGRLPVSNAARMAYLAENHTIDDISLDNIHNLIGNLPTREFTTEERKKIEDGFSSLFQINNSLEEFCIRNLVNPINVWYWFKQSRTIPHQRMKKIVMEFLAYMIREILMDDEDGVIPLIPIAGEKTLLEHIETQFHERGYLTAQFSELDILLGRPLDEYLNTHFFRELSDHINLFQYLPKTPFIWHLSSGPEQGFDCYLIIYKWSRDKLMRIRAVYIERRERALVNRQSDLAGNESADAQNEKDKIRRQLAEIETFKGKIDELLAEGYDPILDDGVGKNIAPLQDKGMIPYEVLNKGQLKKYLNADW
jgi:hypothetical protein